MVLYKRAFYETRTEFADYGIRTDPSNAGNTMYGVPPRGHLQGQTRDNSNTRFFKIKRNIYTCVHIYYICRIYIYIYIYMSYHILFEGVCFVLSYPTHIWNAYVAEIFLEIINAKNEACL